MKNSDSRGFTILLAALVASLVLTLGISIFTIAQKQLVLSSLSRSSQYAFYAADTAAECVLFWDSRFLLFSSSTAAASLSTPPTCDGIEIRPSPEFSTIPDIFPSGGFNIEFELRNLFTSNEVGNVYPGNCAKVVVTKSPTNPRTVVHADGFSTTCEEIESSSRSLQRSVELTY